MFCLNYKIILILCLYCVLKGFYCCSAVPQVSWLQSAVRTTGLLLCLGKHWKTGLLVLPSASEQALNICTNTHPRVHINNQQVHAHPYIYIPQNCIHAFEPPEDIRKTC